MLRDSSGALCGAGRAAGVRAAAARLLTERRSAGRTTGVGRLAIADLAGQRQVAGTGRPDQRGAWLHGRACVDDRRQRFEVDVDRLRSVDGGRLGLGHHHDNGLADWAHGVHRQNRVIGNDRLEPRRQAQGRVGRSGPIRVVRNGPQPTCDSVRASQDRKHPRHDARPGNID